MEEELKFTYPILNQVIFALLAGNLDKLFGNFFCAYFCIFCILCPLLNNLQTSAKFCILTNKVTQTGLPGVVKINEQFKEQKRKHHSVT